ncbi:MULTISPECIES: polyphosphate polymerase domain-containing protein [unclassified Jeotgalibaca]|uniref:polyphosphate polymerase domain-containing protein n=1 Tax=unclassified Jeotgalibaca TaxID=2621505 RepID=UPI003FD54272
MSQNNQNVVLRNEMKFLCHDSTLQIIRQRLQPLLRMDDYTDKTGGFYQVNSLYFDDYDNTCFYDNEYSLGERRKFRVRTYNDNGQFIKLEKKAKDNNLSQKTSCTVSVSEFQQLFSGDVGALYWQADRELLQEFCLEVMTKLFQPKVIVTYERTAFVDFPGNVRVTLDRNISASYQKDRFLTNDYLKVPVLDAGMNLLEIKFDEFLPQYIKQAIQMDGLEQTTFSKYYMARSAVQTFGGNKWDN